MKITWQRWLPMQPFIKKSNDISYETTEPILMKLILSIYMMVI